LNWDALWTALALVLVIEGLFPFMSPGAWKRTFARLLDLQEGQLRFFGLCSMLIGLVLFWLTSSG
jgi:uncharacterized protein YjeT (DUF2065 family)